MRRAVGGVNQPNRLQLILGRCFTFALASHRSQKVRVARNHAGMNSSWEMIS
jgi:hypothetical protein